MKKKTIGIITVIIVTAMIVSLFFFIPWFLAQEDETTSEAYQETQR